MRKSILFSVLAGSAAGGINGLFGAGGGMILVPLLTKASNLQEHEVFPASISIILPICFVSLTLGCTEPIPWKDAFPYLVGSAMGGIFAGLWGRKIPTIWLHRGLGVLILYGGWRYLW